MILFFADQAGWTTVAANLKYSQTFMKNLAFGKVYSLSTTEPNVKFCAWVYGDLNTSATRPTHKTGFGTQIGIGKVR